MKWRPHWGLDGPLVAIGDTHFPFHDARWLDWTYEQIERLQPRYVVQVGDLFDNYAFSRFARSHSVMTPEEEVERGDRAANEMWGTIAAIVPNAVKYQIKGNHDDRVEHRALEKMPELAAVVDFNARYQFPGVSLVREANQELWIGDVAVHHGHKKSGAHARWNQAPTIVGHLHRGDIVWMQNRSGHYWELNAGYGGDETSAVFRYRYQNDIHGWTKGLGLVDEYGPHFLKFGGSR